MEPRSSKNNIYIYFLIFFVNLLLGVCGNHFSSNVENPCNINYNDKKIMQRCCGREGEKAGKKIRSDVVEEKKSKGKKLKN